MPLVSIGTPAVTTMVSPFVASPLASASLRQTSKSWVVPSKVSASRGTTPQEAQSSRTVAMWEEMARMGWSGRVVATSLAVDPLVVGVTISFAPTLSAISFVASAIAAGSGAVPCGSSGVTHWPGSLVASWAWHRMRSRFT